MASSNQECGTRFFCRLRLDSGLASGEYPGSDCLRLRVKRSVCPALGKNVPVPAARDQASYCPNVIFQLEIIPASFNF